MFTKYALKRQIDKVLGQGLINKRIKILLWNLHDVKNILINYCYSLGKKQEDIFDYKSVLKRKHGILTGYYRGNSFYGIEFVIKRYAKIKCPIPACIEHGIYFGSYVNDIEVNESGLPMVVTMSNNRKEHISKKYDKPVLAIGPYISYAIPMFDKEYLLTIKEKLKKTLLVFPVHSTEFVNAQYESSAFINEIKRIQKKYGFNTVIICLYFKDILNGAHTIYEKEDFTIVTAGYRENKYFLDRLRTFIEISDMTMSNAVGTHLGYSVSLNKGHYIFNQQCNYNGTGFMDKSLALPETFYDDNILEKNELIKAFSMYSERISRTQRDIVDKYWGLNLNRSPEQLYDIFTNFNRYVRLNANDKYYSSLIMRELDTYYRKYF